MDDRPGQLGLVCSTLGDLEVNLKRVELIKENPSNNVIQMEMLIKIPTRLEFTEIISALENLSGVHKVTIE
ncbi:MAG: hypothetical protein PHP79_09510 [Clostridia bacterium]|nr:hypothetical protein [Clostridia bacterium]